MACYSPFWIYNFRQTVTKDGQLIWSLAYMAHVLFPIVIATYGRITVELRGLPQGAGLEDLLRLQQNCRPLLAQGRVKLEQWNRELSSLELPLDCASAISLLSRITSDAIQDLEDFDSQLVQNVEEAKHASDRNADFSPHFSLNLGTRFSEASKAIWPEINRLLDLFGCHNDEGYAPPDFLIDQPEEAAFVAERGLGENRCQWRDCSKPCIVGLAFCYEHYFNRPER